MWAARHPGDLGGSWRQEERTGPGSALAMHAARKPAVAGMGEDLDARESK